MKTDAQARLYDEDSVFNRLFAEDKPPSQPGQGDRLRDIFSGAKTTEKSIAVEDFLPRY